MTAKWSNDFASPQSESCTPIPCNMDVQEQHCRAPEGAEEKGASSWQTRRWMCCQTARATLSWRAQGFTDLRTTQ